LPRQRLHKLSERKQPQHYTRQNGSAFERSGSFGISRGYSAPTFELEESLFNKMPNFVNFFIIKSLLFAIFIRRNNCYYPIFFGKVNNFVAVITSAGK
jgi:hypothetical protein